MAGVEKSLFGTLALSGLVLLVGQVSYNCYAAEQDAKVGQAITAAEYRQRRAEYLAQWEASMDTEPEVPAVQLSRLKPELAQNLLNACESNSPSRSLGRCGKPIAMK